MRKTLPLLALLLPACAARTPAPDPDPEPPPPAVKAAPPAKYGRTLVRDGARVTVLWAQNDAYLGRVRGQPQSAMRLVVRLLVENLDGANDVTWPGIKGVVSDETGRVYRGGTLPMPWELDDPGIPADFVGDRAKAYNGLHYQGGKIVLAAGKKYATCLFAEAAAPPARKVRVTFDDGTGMEVGLTPFP